MHGLEIVTLEKYNDLETLIRGHQMSLAMTAFDRS